MEILQSEGSETEPRYINERSGASGSYSARRISEHSGFAEQTTNTNGEDKRRIQTAEANAFRTRFPKSSGIHN